ncbi:hypothetical protein ACFC0S_03135 [Streptomyces sp. NPDC056084]|uniref:hypothetical protein n=1 Tax=unclassified Streptomyces TaxID=2593676 RepID=UPI0035D74478
MNFDALKAFLRDNPVRVRAGIAAVLVLVAQTVPAVADVAVNDTVVDFLTFLVVLICGESASRQVAAKYNPGD